MASADQVSKSLRPIREILAEIEIDGVPISNALIVRHDLQNLERMRQECRDKKSYRPDGNYDYLLKANGNGVNWVVIFEATNEKNAVLHRVYRCIGAPEPLGNKNFYWEEALEPISRQKLSAIENKLVIEKWPTQLARSYCLKNEKKGSLQGYLCDGHRSLEDVPDCLTDVFLKWGDLAVLMERNHLYRDWQKALQGHDGVYAIRNVDTGHLYVGTTYNQGKETKNPTQGIWDRWNGYYRTQHNGNALLKTHVEQHGTDKLRICLLEVWKKGKLEQREATTREDLWKKKLGSRSTAGKGGLNHN